MLFKNILTSANATCFLSKLSSHHWVYVKYIGVKKRWEGDVKYNPHFTCDIHSMHTHMLVVREESILNALTNILWQIGSFLSRNKMYSYNLIQLHTLSHSLMPTWAVYTIHRIKQKGTVGSHIILDICLFIKFLIKWTEVQKGTNLWFSLLHSSDILWGTALCSQFSLFNTSLVLKLVYKFLLIEELPTEFFAKTKVRYSCE